MNELTFPPSPNWYLNNILTCASDDSVVYGSRSNLVILKSNLVSSEKRNPEISIISNAHKERVTAVAFSTCKGKQEKLYNCLASAGDDSVIKVWDLNTLMPILAHVSHGEGQKLVGLDWSRADPKLIVSVDESSYIVCWDLFSNSTHRIYVGKLQPTCLACCPHKRELIAIGTRAGLVCIINVKGTGKIVYRLRGHDSDVVSLSWCPVKGNVFQLPASSDKEPARDMLLASGSKQRAIYIWRAGGDGRYETVLTISGQLAGIQSRSIASSDGNWVCVYWAEPFLLLAGTKGGRLLSWDLQAVQSNRNKPKGGGDAAPVHACRLLHSAHSRGLFCIACPQQPALEGDNEGNWRERKEGQGLVWTISQDRPLVAYDMLSGGVVATIPTIGGIVYCIAASPIDPNRVAFGVGDAVIRVWDLSSPNAFEVVLLWQKIKGKITALAWHPTRENWLAFGTTEGRVGLYDVSSAKQSPILFRPHHCHSLYTLCWGPPLFSKGVAEAETEQGAHYALYSCGDSEIVQYNHNKPDAEPKNLKNLSQLANPNKKKEARCDLAWKSDNSLLAVGNEDGTVQVFSLQHMEVLCTLYAHKKLIHKLAWHPEGTATDAGYSPYQHWLAVASKDSIIKVYDLGHIAQGEDNTGQDQPSQMQSIATLAGHLSGIVSICWSPHISGQLVSVSYDETAQVWDVPNQQPLGNFSLHCGFLYSCAWSPLDPDLVMTGAADFTLRIWKVSTLINKLPVDKKKQRKLESKNSKAAEVAESGIEESTAKQEDVPTKPLPKVIDENDSSIEIATKEKGKKKSVRSRSYFPVSSQAWVQGRKHNLEHCQGTLGTQGATGPSFFGDRAAMLQLLDQEEQYHTSTGNAEYAQHMALWKGNLGETIKEAACKKQLSDWLVSLAPMVSQRLWQEATRAYAEQLCQAGNYQKAASYLLACHKVDEAIEMLTSQKLFREAISIAKCRLGPDDPSITKIIREWVRQLSSDGHYELAAECLVSFGELEEAAELLGRRSDEDSLRLAVSIARQAEAWDRATVLATQCIRTSLLHKNWKLAKSVAEEHDNVRHFVLLILTHKTIYELLVAEKEPDIPLLAVIVNKYKEEHRVPVEELYEALEKGIEKILLPDSVDKLWLSVSEDLSLSSCASSVPTQLRHLVTAAASCYQYQVLRQNIHPLYQLITWLAPLDPFTEGSIFTRESDLNEEADLLRSLKSYLFAGLFHWLHDSKMVQVPANGTEEEESIKEESEKESEDDWQRIAVPALKDYAACIDSNTDTMLYFQDQVEIKKWEQEVASAMARGRTGLPPTETEPHVQVLDSKVTDEQEDFSLTTVGLQKLEQLKKRKERFEKQRLSAPNPFITHCIFRNICNFLIKEKELSVVEDILKDAEVGWKTLESSAVSK